MALYGFAILIIIFVLLVSKYILGTINFLSIEAKYIILFISHTQEKPRSLEMG